MPQKSGEILMAAGLVEYRARGRIESSFFHDSIEEKKASARDLGTISLYSHPGLAKIQLELIDCKGV